MEASHGHPQCRKKATTSGLPSSAGKVSLGEEGAFSPTSGGLAVCRLVGNIHDRSSVCQDMVIGGASRVQNYWDSIT